ncbi:MAG: hypothetical protein JWO36_2907 [Myxococcales bacterium]|nr:hypothetical protein [Myxococcales bacterium]
MDRIRTLLLARTHVVVLDHDQIANAATRPTRDTDVDKFEDELAQLGFVMSMDLAMTMRRLPYQAIEELRGWIFATLAKQLGAHRPHVPLFRGFPAGTPGDPPSLYLRRIVTWLLTVPNQPCPWCGEIKAVGALDPCGHLVCRTCWGGGNYAGCPICHRRVALGDPFVKPAATAERVQKHGGTLTLLHLAFDLLGTAKERFQRLLARTTPLSPDDLAEVEAVIDAVGPKAMSWLPAKIPVRETMAVAVGRLWVTAPDRSAMVKATAGHIRTATDVLRIAVVLMGGNAPLVEPIHLSSIGRSLRRAILQALDGLPIDRVIEDVGRHARLWKRVGERLHPYEHAERHPNAALAFAVARGTKASTATFAAVLENRAKAVRVVRDRFHVDPWAGPVEQAMRRRDPRAAIARLVERPGELLRRVDHVVRVAQATDALEDVLEGVQQAIARGEPATLLTLASHIARRDAPWPRRVFFPKGEVLHAWGAPDQRAPLRKDVIDTIVSSVRIELVARAEAQRHFPRAVIDRALVDLPVPINERTASAAKLAWPRGSEIALPRDAGGVLRLFLHWEEPATTRVDLDLSVALFDASWRHVGTCDFTNLVVGDRVAIHSGDLTSAPPPLGASEFVDLDLVGLAKLGARHLVMVVFSYNSVPFDRLPHGFAGLMVAPAEGLHFDPRAVAQRFDLRGRSLITVPLSIDLADRRLRWLDVHVADRGALQQVGGYRAALAHLGRDFADLAGSRARPTMWDVACIHAAARANIVYVRERDGSVTMYRRRDDESTVARLGRLLSGGSDDGKSSTIPPANAPTWFALVTGDLALPKGSAGYMLDARSIAIDDRRSAGDLISALAAP